MHFVVRSRKFHSPKDYSRRPLPPNGGWTYSFFSAALFALVLGATVTIPALFLFKDHLPARVQYLPRYVETQIKRRQPHPAYVPTPTARRESAPPLIEVALKAAAPTVAPAPVTSSTGAANVRSAAREADAPRNPAVGAVARAMQEPAPVAAPSPAVAVAPALPVTVLQGVHHEYQRWNNCGPVTIGMQLSFFGRTETQFQTAPFLKPDPDDKNVSPDELVAYARSIGFESFASVGGDLDLLKRLVSNQFPVIVESWFIPEPKDEMGHYLLFIGYDDATGELIFNDSYEGPNRHVKAAEFDRLWQVFNRTFVLSYPPERAPVAQAILGELGDSQAMYTHALHIAQAEVAADQNNRYAWFNLGSSFVGLGEMEKAAEAFDQARSLKLPWRMLWYQFGPFQAYYAVGRYQDVIDLATANLHTTGDLEESFYWRGRAQQALGNLDSARRDYQQALRYNKNFTAAADALAALQ
ncbi:MAG: C39 family peptidase [Ardenticatenaceae bacterium]|nr:C39 family peptidase [Ardenticatenaceae bacterium]